MFRGHGRSRYDLRPHRSKLDRCIRVCVYDPRQLRSDPDLDTKLLAKLAPQRVFGALVPLDLTARQLPCARAQARRPLPGLSLPS